MTRIIKWNETLCMEYNKIHSMYSTLTHLYLRWSNTCEHGFTLKMYISFFTVLLPSFCSQFYHPHTIVYLHLLIFRIWKWLWVHSGVFLIIYIHTTRSITHESHDDVLTLPYLLSQWHSVMILDVKLPWM